MSSTATPDNTLAVQWVLGALVVLMYAWDRFRKPAPTRSTTTFWRYWSAGLGYAIAMLALFVLLGGGIISFDIRALAPLIGEIPSNVASLPGPLLSALVLTSLLPHLPVLARIDEALKQWFWDVGNIPTEVRMLGTHLAAERYLHRAPEHPTQTLAGAFSEYGADLQWLAQPDGSLKLRWARCVALFAHLKQWEGERGYARYLEQNKAELTDLRSRMAGLSEWLGARTLSELDSGGDSAALAHLRKIVEGDITSLWRSMCLFAAGGVLNETWNDRQRRIALARLGFIGPPQETKALSSHDIVLVMGLVFIAMLFIPLAMRRFFDPDMLPLQWRVLVMVPIVYAIAIVAAIYPKSVWPNASRAPGGQRPVVAYVASAIVATLAAFIVGLLFRFAFDSHGNVVQALSTRGAFGRAWWTSLERWPWLLMTFFATVSIAWAADDYKAGSEAVPKWLRWAEAAALAVVFGLSQWVVVELLISGAPTAPTALAAQMVDALPRMAITSCVIGACIGFLVPSLYRAKALRPHVLHADAKPAPA